MKTNTAKALRGSWIFLF